MTRHSTLLVGLLLAGACKPKVASMSLAQIPGHAQLAEDTTPKEQPRFLAPEVYIRSYLQLFGGLAPTAVASDVRSIDTGLFDSWNSYLAALGLPDYRIDTPRAVQTNALMMATFERLGVALCDRAAVRDLHGATAPPVSQRLIFTFDAPAGLDAAGFATRFDQLHRTFLGYPAALAPTDRTNRYYQLYGDVVGRHSQKGAPTALTPAEAGWASVCYGLVRHPEFHFY